MDAITKEKCCQYYKTLFSEPTVPKAVQQLLDSNSSQHNNQSNSSMRKLTYTEQYHSYGGNRMNVSHSVQQQTNEDGLFYWNSLTFLRNLKPKLPAGNFSMSASALVIKTTRQFNNIFNAIFDEVNITALCENENSEDFVSEKDFDNSSSSRKNRKILSILSGTSQVQYIDVKYSSWIPLTYDIIICQSTKNGLPFFQSLLKPSGILVNFERSDGWSIYEKRKNNQSTQILKKNLVLNEFFYNGKKHYLCEWEACVLIKEEELEQIKHADNLKKNLKKIDSDALAD